MPGLVCGTPQVTIVGVPPHRIEYRERGVVSGMSGRLRPRETRTELRCGKQLQSSYVTRVAIHAIPPKTTMYNAEWAN